MARQRIGLLVGQPDEIYQKDFIEGFLKRTFSFDYDVCIFAMYKKYQETADREIGESNIFSLMSYDQFDGIVVLADTIQTTGLLERLEYELHDYFNGPVLFVDKESKFFPSISTDHFHPTKRLIAHLIEHHGFHKIAYLTGKSWHPHSIQRLNGFMDSMSDHGLEIRKDWIFEGDFWYTSGESMVEKLLKTPDDLPEVIACANDCMAIGVANALEKKGIRVPEDIAVIGYDSSEEGKYSPRPLTSAPIPFRDCGKHAGSYIHSLLCGEYIPDFKPNVELFIGSSCGCQCDHTELYHTQRSNWEVTISERDMLSSMNYMMDDLMSQDKIQNLMNVIFSYTYQIEGFDSFHICLNEQWQDMNALCKASVDWNHYSPKMLYALECRASVDNPGRVDLERFFDKSELIPELNEERDEPKAYFFTPLHFEDRCMGYAVVSYGKKNKSYARTYGAWLANVMRGLESFRRLAFATYKQNVIQKLKEATEEQNEIANSPVAFEGFASTAIANGSAMDDTEAKERQLVEEILNHNLLTYHFQPIVAAKTGEIYAYEALMRSNTETRISPLAILKHAENLGRLYDVEKYTLTNVLQYISSHKDLFEGKKVFINSIPGTTLTEEDMQFVTELVQNNKEQIVIELTEQTELEDDQLAQLKEKFKQMGVETAIDDYGTGYSNVTNLLRYMPQYVKIDRMLLTDIQKSPQKQHFVKEIIEFSHDNDITVLAEGVETNEELQTVISLGADLIQGYYTARPSDKVVKTIDVNIKREIHQFVKQLQFDKNRKVYTAGKEFRISLAKLHSDGYEYIVIPNDETTYRDLNIIGVPGMDSNIIIQVADGYRGRLVINNVILSGKRGNPCIDIGEDCELTLDLRGENEFKTGGIRVPDNAKLILEGEGNLSISANYDGCFSIGNDMDKRHGDIVFDQDGMIECTTNAKEGVAIGSGLGGNIVVNRGKYIFHMTGNSGVVFGCLEGGTDVKLNSCDITIHQSLYAGAGIGSLKGNVTCAVKHTSLAMEVEGTDLTGIGSIEGSTNILHLHNSNIQIKAAGQKICGAGCIHKKADIDICFASLDLEVESEQATLLGDISNQSSLIIKNSKIVGNSTGLNANIIGVSEDQKDFVNARFSLTHNKEEQALWNNIK